MAAGAYASRWSGESTLIATGQSSIHWKWATLCALSIVPFAAILHHAIFYPTQCMLNAFGAEYSLAVIKTWLSRDPSILGASLIATGLYRLGLSRSRLRIAMPAFLLAFLPLSIWIWDVPFAGRWICTNFHDLQVHLPGGMPLRTRYLYLVGIVLFPALHLLMRRGTFSWPVAARKPLRSQEA